MTESGWWARRSGLAGTVAVVTGGGGGIGEAVSMDLAANGVGVAVLDHDPEAVEGITEHLAGADAIVQLGDAREPEALDRLFAAVSERWSRLDTLVNVVGGGFRAPFLSTSPRAWDALLRVNFLHVLHATARAVPAMRAGGRGGSIVNVTSIEADRGAPGFAVYSATKAATAHFTRSLAVELAPEGIRVNNVAPDITPTPKMLQVADPSSPDNHWMLDPDNIRRSIPVARVGRTEEVSGPVVFLASALSSYITGTTLRPDGGTWASAGWFNWQEEGWSVMLPPTLLDLIHHSEGVNS